MKTFLILITMLTISNSAFAISKEVCLTSAQALDQAIAEGRKGLNLSMYYEKTAKDCGINKQECENDEPGTAWYFYNAHCILNKAAEVLNN